MESQGLAGRIERIKEEHRRRFGGGDVRVVAAPFRICPLGAHVDHQHGLVTGMALENCIVMAFSPNPDGRVNLQSMNFPADVSFTISENLSPAKDWGDYARGAAIALLRRHGLGTGLNAVLEGDMPIGGLSSSAACGVAYLLALEAVNDFEMSPEDNIELDRVIENEFIGLSNGILDQSVILLSEKGRLLHMDCRDESYERVNPGPRMPEFDLLVVYSGVSKKLVDTDYNRRVHECDEAARRLLELAGRPALNGSHVRLRDLSPEDFVEHGGALDANPRKRARHFFSECARVRLGLDAWNAGDLERFGLLMMESGQSSINNYECGCEPLIDLTEIMNRADGVYGARFSGAGFRGCCIGLSDPARRESIRETIEREYPRLHPEYKNDFKVIFCRAGDGAHFVKG